MSTVGGVTEVARSTPYDNSERGRPHVVHRLPVGKCVRPPFLPRQKSGGAARPVFHFRQPDDACCSNTEPFREKHQAMAVWRSPSHRRFACERPLARSTSSSTASGRRPRSSALTVHAEEQIILMSIICLKIPRFDGSPLAASSISTLMSTRASFMSPSGDRRSIDRIPNVACFHRWRPDCLIDRGSCAKHSADKRPDLD